ncbi:MULTISPECIES: hypothetical protein [unclassified Afipia]|uniref:hypothetical protein n=1 Tax=unclassified Afipia TaxID=2642050 RepID=UPI0004135D33|nr:MULTISPECIES: hypothetical protein [unclassified Afipia]
MKHGPDMTPEQRARISEMTKARMANPEVRERISRRTKEAKAAAAAELPEWLMLRMAWTNARPGVRKRFLDEIVWAGCIASASKDPGVA